MAFWYYPRVLFRARGVDVEVGLHPLNGRWQQPFCLKANIWLIFTIQETFSSSSMAFDGSLRPKESLRRHQNRILSHLFQLYVKICWESRNVCYPFMTYRKSTRGRKKHFADNTTPVYTVKRPTGSLVPGYVYKSSTWWFVSLFWLYWTDWFHSLQTKIVTVFKKVQIVYRLFLVDYYLLHGNI